MTTASEVVHGRDLHGRVAVVTGATSGLGRATARALASAGAEVVLAGRDPARLESACAEVAEAGAVAPRSVTFDLADLASVRAGAAAIAAQVQRVDVLVDNAGVMFSPLTRTAQGHELQFGTNHLGHFLLTVLLRPLLLAASPARVVVLSSAGHRMADVDLDDPDWRERDYDKFLAYGAAKSANLLFARELDRRWGPDGIRAFAVHPGTVRTDLARHMDRDDVVTMRGHVARLAAETGEEPLPMRYVEPDEGAATSVWAAVAEELDGRGGLYLADCAVSDRVAPWALDDGRAARLWQVSEQLVAAYR